MTSHVSATVREATPHVNQTTRTNTIFNALKQRAQAVLNDRSIDAQSRAIIRQGLETNDPWLAELVSRADAGETIVDTDGFLQTRVTGLGGHPNPAIQGHLKTGHREEVVRDVDGAARQASLQRHEQRIERR